MLTVTWAVSNTLRALVAATAGYAVLAVAGAVGAEQIDLGEYLFTLFSSAVFMWPVYLAAIAAASKRERFRLWAVALCPLLGLGLTVANVAITSPELLAADIAYVLTGVLVVPHPRRTSAPD